MPSALPEAVTKEVLLAKIADMRGLANEAERLLTRLDVTAPGLADEQPENERVARVAQLLALEAECVAMADEARALIARLDSITLPAPH